MYLLPLSTDSYPWLIPFVRRTCGRPVDRLVGYFVNVSAFSVLCVSFSFSLSLMTVFFY